jgi:hypothetical protein
MAAAAAGILAVGAERKPTADGAAVVVGAAPQHMRPKRKPREEQAGLKIS